MKIIFLLIIITIVAVFSVQNASPVTISFLFGRFEASLAIVISLSMLGGAIIGVISTFIFRRKKRLEENKSGKKIY